MANLIVSLSAIVNPLVDPEISGVQWTLADPNITASGYFAHGGMYIVVPTGSATISRSNITPAAGANSETNGLMKNPTVGQTWGFGAQVNPYSAAVNITTSTTVSANDVLVLGVGNPTNDLFLGFSVLHVLGSVPPANAICPPVFGYDGSTARPMHTLDIAAAVSSLPTFDYTGLFQLYTPAQNASLIRSIEPFVAASGPLETHRRRHGANAEGYGRDQAQIWSRAFHTILNAAATTAQRQRLLGWMMTNACTWDYAMQRGSTFGTDGAWGQGAIASIKLWRRLTGQALTTGFNMNELEQPMIIDQSFLDAMLPHSGTAGRPAIARRQTVLSVNGLTLTMTGTGILQNDTRLIGTRLVRESDNATANILDAVQASNGANVTLTLETSNPFAVNDVVYARDRQGFVLGDITWGVRGRNGGEGLQRWSPSPYPRYSQLQIWDPVMFLACMGTQYLDNELLPCLKWIKTSMASNIPASGDHFTAAYADYPEVIGHGGSGGGNTGQAFWTAHGETAVDAAIAALEA
jgi:hypothetical protein